MAPARAPKARRAGAGASESPGAGPVRYAAEGAVARVTLDRPPLHILDLATIAALDAALAAAAADPGVAVVVLQSSGTRAFSAGVDVADHVPARVDAMLDGFHAVIRRLLTWDRVTIARVRGVALGGGFELAAACDLIVADDTAEFGQPEIGIGCFPPAAAALLPSAIGPWRAADLVLSGRRVKAAEAKAMGLVCDVVPAAKLDAALDAFVTEFCTRSPAVLRAARAALAAARAPVLDALAASERVYRERLVPLADMQEGIAAFLEKRTPVWRNR